MLYNLVMAPRDFHKITQILNYIAVKAGSQNIIRRIKAIKLTYFADRYHLRKYARLVTEDRYCGMRFGPVASLALDIARKTQLSPEEERYIYQYLKDIGANHFASIAAPDLDYFSETDLEALDFAVSNFGHLDWQDLCDLSHAYPEWDKNRSAIRDLFKLRFPIDCKDFFDDANPKHQDLRFTNYSDLFQGVVSNGAKEAYLEQLEIKQVLVT